MDQNLQAIKRYNDIVIAVDPGIEGVILVLENGTKVHPYFIPKKTYKFASGKTRNDVDFIKLQEKMEEILMDFNAENPHIIFEAVHSMHKQGISSAFQFGKTTGTILGIVSRLITSHNQITFMEPMRWAKYLVDIGVPGETAKEKAEALFKQEFTALSTKANKAQLSAIYDANAMIKCAYADKIIKY